jgi:hypothetical protein
LRVLGAILKLPGSQPSLDDNVLIKLVRLS